MTIPLPYDSSMNPFSRIAKDMRFIFLIATAMLPISGLAGQPALAPIPPGSPMSESIHFELAIYYLPLPSKSPVEALRQQVAKVSRELKVTDRMPDAPAAPVVRARLEKDVRKNYSPPDTRSLQYFGRGLSREQAEGLQSSAQALILDFGHPKSKVWEALRDANELVERTARETGGLIWDEETREVFTPDEWHVSRIASWSGGMPEVSKQTVIHAYKDNDFVRAITLGMAKMGLPDVVMDDFSWSMNRPVGNLINLFCQAMAEGKTIGENGEFDLNLKAIRHPAARESQLKHLKPNAEAIARLTLLQGKNEEGDPANRLIRITADRYPEHDVHAKLDKMLSSLFGSEDAIVRIRHNDALRKASENARLKLPSLRREFAAGLRPGEFIQVKAPFATPAGSNEWMWVEVSSWNGDAIEGLLKNEPFDIPTLHGGQMVKVRERDIFDYIRQFPDGHQEGNETGKIILQMQQQK